MMDDKADELDDDPIVAEIREIRERLGAKFNYDLHAIAEDARRRTEELRRQGWPVVSPPAPATKNPNKKAG